MPGEAHPEQMSGGEGRQWRVQLHYLPLLFLSRGQAGLDMLESNSTLRKRNYLSEVKESGSHARSSSPTHSALIPGNSLGGMKVH